MNDSLIEWAPKTWNPITGCPGPKVSPGCANCYAERTAKTRLAGRYGYDADDPFGIHVHDERWLQPLKAKKPQRIFVCSMGDLFHECVSLQYVAKVFAVMAMCPQHTFILLTKRADRMEHFITDTSTLANDRRGVAYQEIASAAGRDCNMDGLPWPLPNVWLGVTVCTPNELHQKVIPLIHTPAAKHVVSVEPMLVGLDFTRIQYEALGDVWMHNALTGEASCADADGNFTDWSDPDSYDRIHWVICGGETGPGARPMHPDWVRGLRDQCLATGTPFFFKSWGEWKADHEYSDGLLHVDGEYVAADDIGEPWGHTTAQIARVGKRRSGRLLDGREWNEVPV